MSTRAAIYARVSTDEQATEGTSLDTQLERCRAYAQARGWEVAAEFREDRGESGAKAARPALDHLMAACRRGEVDAVIVAKLDRFGRSNRHLAAALGELDDLGVAFASVAESVDSSTPSGRFLRTLLGGAAEFERDMILERTAAGLKARVRAGYWPGGPAPYGFQILDKGSKGRQRLEIYEPEAEILRKAASLIVDDDCTVWTAARTLNGLGLTPRKAPRWVHNHLRRTLLSPTLAGRWTYGTGSDAVEMEIPAILDPERHAALTSALTAAATGPKTPSGQRHYLLSRGRLFGLCGAPLHGCWRVERHSRAYRCNNRRPDVVDKCDDHPINADLVEEIVWGEVVALLSEPDRLLAMANKALGLRSDEASTHQEQLDGLDRKIAALQEARTERVVAALKAGIDPAALKAATDELAAEERALTSHRDRVRAWRDQSEAETDRAHRLRELAAGARERLASMAPPQRREVLDLLDVRVTITGWKCCDACGGKGRVKGGRGGLSCPGCRAMRRVPLLRIEGFLDPGLGLPPTSGNSRAGSVGAAHLADDDAVGAHAQRVAHEAADRHLARALQRGRPRLEAHDVGVAQPQLGGVLDGDDPLAVADELRQRVERRRLARAGAAADEHVAARADRAGEQVAQRSRPGAVGDELVGAEAAAAKAPDREDRAVERQRRDDDVHARAVGQPRVAERLALVDAPPQRREDALDRVAQVGLAGEARGGRLDAAFTLDPDPAGPVDHHLVDGVVGQEGLERPEAERALGDPLREPCARGVVEQARLAVDERPDALVDVDAREAGVGLGEQPVAQRPGELLERLVAVHARLRAGAGAIRPRPAGRHGVTAAARPRAGPRDRAAGRRPRAAAAAARARSPARPRGRPPGAA